MAMLIGDPEGHLRGSELESVSQAFAESLRHQRWLLLLVVGVWGQNSFCAATTLGHSPPAWAQETKTPFPHTAS